MCLHIATRVWSLRWYTQTIKHSEILGGNCNKSSLQMPVNHIFLIHRKHINTNLIRLDVQAKSLIQIILCQFLTHHGLVSHMCVMKSSSHSPSDAYMRHKSLYFFYRPRGAAVWGTYKTVWGQDEEWVSLRAFWDGGHRGPCSPYKLCHHNLYIGITIFPHIDNTQYTGHNKL